MSDVSGYAGPITRLRAGHGRQAFRPWQCRAAPLLLAWDQCLALVQAADAQAVDPGVVCVIGVQGRAEIGAERLGAPRSGIADLHVDGRLSADQLKRAFNRRHRDAVGRAGELLAVGAVADSSALGVDLDQLNVSYRSICNLDNFGSKAAQAISWLLFNISSTGFL